MKGSSLFARKVVCARPEGHAAWGALRDWTGRWFRGAEAERQSGGESGMRGMRGRRVRKSGKLTIRRSLGSRPSLARVTRDFRQILQATDSYYPERRVTPGAAGLGEREKTTECQFHQGFGVSVHYFSDADAILCRRKHPVALTVRRR